MIPYDQFAPFYDAAMDDPAPRAARVRRAVERFGPEATSLLELGCGTGSILAGLADYPSLTGLDQSVAMLSVASQKVPSARLLQGDIRAFWLGERFDVVCCVFDTLNHLLNFDDWRSMFESVYDHLVPGGLFVFDVNTIGELRRLGDEPPLVFDFGPHVLIMDVTTVGGGLSAWDIRIFEHREGPRFELHRERIGELGVPLARLKEALAPRFHLLDESSDGAEVPTDSSVKAYFVYRREP
jgi:SAM-dependent methyltransferase